jgi:hypothetical protein
MSEAMVERWISQLSEPNPKFGGQPECAFAQNAWRKATVEFEDCGLNLLDRLLDISTGYVEEGKVHLLKFDVDGYYADLLDDIVAYYNELQPHLLFLATHPLHDEPSHPTLGLVFVQRKADMIAAVDYLRTTSYYDNNPLPEWYVEAHAGLSRRSSEGAKEE